MKHVVKQAEYAGFSYCWFYDSHILWRESFASMAMCIEHTESMRFGPCVTNPNTRDWSHAASLFGSLAKQSNGRFEIGVGRGDSAVRVMGKKPSPLARMEEFIHAVKALVRGEEVQYGECPAPVKFPWTENYELPAWVAAYGPKALSSAGRVGDGLILQIAEPTIVKWLADQAKKAGKLIKEKQINIDLYYSSFQLRAKNTLQIIQKELKYIISMLSKIIKSYIKLSLI